MGRARIGTIENEVHLGRGERDGWRIDPHIARAWPLTMALHHGTRIARVGLEMKHARSVGIQHRVGLHLLIGRQADHAVRAVGAARGQTRGGGHDAHRLGAIGCGLGRCSAGLHCIGVGMGVDASRPVQCQRIDLLPLLRRPPARLHHEGRATQVANGVDRLATRQTMGQRHQRTLGVAEQQDVGLGIGQHRTPHLVRPVVVMRNAPQAGLDAADDDRRAGIGLARTLGIHRHRAVRAFARLGVGRVGIVRANLAVGGVAIDQRIHVAGGDAKVQPRPAQRAKGFGRLPVRLTEDADTKAVRLQHAPDQGHAKAGVVNVGIAGDEDDVALVPAQHRHLLA